jgi:hypothetical protein
MITKSLIAVAAVAASMTFLAPANEAKAGGVDIDVNLGIGGFHPGYGYGYGHGYGYGYPVYDDYDYGISCSKGRKIVRRNGFRNVTAIDCHGSTYQYKAWKHGNPYKVRVNSYGEIVRVRPL